MIIRFLFICELQDLDIIWFVNFMILTKVFISGFSINHNKSNSSLKITYFMS